MRETMRPIPSLPAYAVDENGDIWRGDRKRKPYVPKIGPPSVGIRLEGRSRTFPVHALVCEAYHGERPKGAECRHLDGDNRNNRPDNLCWAHPKALRKHKGRATVVDAKEVRRILHYDPGTGIFRWRARTGVRTVVGAIAGYKKRRGHIEIKLAGKRYQAHRLAWLWMTGEWPLAEIDHRDWNPNNNRWNNLREATGAGNNTNKPVQKNNKLGIKGVHRKVSRRGRESFVAQIKTRGKVIGLGRFPTAAAAYEAYRGAVAAYHGEFAPLLPELAPCE